ncbi:hypothetical protein BO94DRAFT_575395 [Aspergillus sclerotioniger CBS 115572]|uniref:Uncharacterized protein n=1 Tax=Aspergillus sclerotioniger CBS 115572 TaxID=1450535 RepID=A0A317WLI1_9EURO|nr:hypothetical protein BO94DRAFT_575395 [Aspergillus sclerotioniger CBS 115572]PWY87334.1 hypothetical protein BO94DRAFT_575395 [Aspergillus sclerotioniger CBS 115572]
MQEDVLTGPSEAEGEGKGKGEDNKARSDAINLIRARTITRTSPTEASSQEGSSHEPTGIQCVVMDVPVVEIEPVPASKKAKKKKKANKNKRLLLGDAGSGVTGGQPELVVQKASTKSSSSAGKEDSSISASHLQNITAESDQRDALIQPLRKLDIKGKRRVRRVDPVTGNEIFELVPAPRVPQPVSTARDTVISPSYATVLSGKRTMTNPTPAPNNGSLCNPLQSPTISVDMKPSDTASQAPAQGSSELKAASTEIPAQNDEGLDTTQPPQSMPKSANAGRPMLSPIREVSGEFIQRRSSSKGPVNRADQEVPGSGSFAETQSLFTSTPKSNSTTSTGWTNLALPISPQTTEASELSCKGADHRSQTNSSGSRKVHSSQVISSHAHPPPPPSPSSRYSISTPTVAISNTQGTLSTQKPEGFFWQLDSHGFPCAKKDCDKRCNLWDGATVICPRCGPYSEIRYCSKTHLLEDIKTHWLYCGQLAFRHPCRETSIPKAVRAGPPLIPCLHPYDMPERHRQAVYFNVNARQGDYFVFADWADYVKADFPEDRTAVRCSNKVVYVVKFDGPAEKDRFRRVLAACLFCTSLLSSSAIPTNPANLLVTLEVTELVDYLFRLIRDKLRSVSTAEHILDAVRYQIFQEFNVTIQVIITGERHACETDWDGRNRRNCPDPVCRAEYRRLLGALGGRGLCRLTETLESTYWILRAARTTHPTVSDANKRMMGEGFDEVAEEDRRVFRRGDGWDGAGTGDMELEGLNEYAPCP